MSAPAPGVWETYADAVLDHAIARLAGTAASGDPLEDAVRRRLGDSKSPTKLLRNTEHAVGEARAGLLKAIAEPDDAFAFVGWNAGLDGIAIDVFAIVAAVELDGTRQRLSTVLGGSRDGAVTLGMIRDLFGADGLAAVAPDAPLARSCVLEPIAPIGPWSSHIVHVAPSIVSLLAGAAHRDPELPADAVLVWDNDVADDGDHFVLITGGDRTSRRLLATARCSGSRFVVSPLPNTDEERRAIVRHCVAYGASAICETDADLDPATRQWIDHSTIALALCSKRQLRLDHLPQRPFVEFAVEATNGVDEETGHFIDAEQRRLADTALRSVDGDLDAAVRRVATGHLDTLAVRTAPGRSWNELVLPEQQVVQLRELVDRYRHRSVVYRQWGFAARPSTGVTAMFAGPSGTGKTMTAEIVATDLGLDLYRIDLSAVVSKYIGETEKNLESLFTASSAGNLVLFFDEADALFGKRTEVSDARDRYANIETSYLLQRLERYEGVVILATNFRNNIDQAFLRRVDLSIDFEIPDEPHRARIWRVVFPDGAPLIDVDIEVLASEFEMSGGSIRNAAVHAAFLAAASDSAITMDHVLIGVQREFQKEGRLRSQTDETVAEIRGGRHVPAAG